MAKLESKTKQECIHCRQIKAENSCDLCSESVCKACLVRLSGEDFAFLENKPAELQHTDYCPFCYDDTIQPMKDDYEAKLAKAREVGIWSKNYRGNVPILKRHRETIDIGPSDDKNTIVLQLGFKAIEMGFNGMIRADIRSEKNRDKGGYVKTKWFITAQPVLVDEEKLNRELDREIWWRELHHR